MMMTSIVPVLGSCLTFSTTFDVASSKSSIKLLENKFLKNAICVKCHTTGASMCAICFAFVFFAKQ